MAITNEILGEKTEEAIAVVTFVDPNSQRSTMVYGYEKRMSQRLRFKVGAGWTIKLNYVEMVREKAFEDCWALKEFILPDSVRFIEIGTFNNCYSMEKLHLSVNMKSFGGSCCENCWSLKEVTMTPDEDFINRIHNYWEDQAKDVRPEDSEYPYPENYYWTYNNALYTNVPRLSNACLVLCLSKDEEFTIPDFVTEVKQYAFTTCKRLKRLHLSPMLHPIARNWDERKYITHEFVFECWPQVEAVSFDDSLNPKSYPICFV